MTIRSVNHVPLQISLSLPSPTEVCDGTSDSRRECTSSKSTSPLLAATSKLRTLLRGSSPSTPSRSATLQRRLTCAVLAPSSRTLSLVRWVICPHSSDAFGNQRPALTRNMSLPGFFSTPAMTFDQAMEQQCAPKVLSPAETRSDVQSHAMLGAEMRFGATRMRSASRRAIYPAGSLRSCRSASLSTLQGCAPTVARACASPSRSTLRTRTEPEPPSDRSSPSLSAPTRSLSSPTASQLLRSMAPRNSKGSASLHSLHAMFGTENSSLRCSVLSSCCCRKRCAY